MWLRRRLADYFIIRASRRRVDDPEPATRFWIDGPMGRIECFASRKFAGQSESVPLGTDAPPDLLILKLPGTAGRAERSTAFPAQLFPDQDVEVWTWNPPGYGRSDGKASLRAIPPSVLDVWDHLLSSRRDNHTKTLVIGNSLGAVTALHLGSARHVDGLMVRNPPPLVEMVRAGDAWWNARRGGSWIAAAIEQEMNAIETASKCNVPALFIRSADDTLVSPRLQQIIFDAYAGHKNLLEIPDADHDTPYSDDDIPLIRDELWSTLGQQFAAYSK